MSMSMRHRCIQNSLLPVPIEYILVQRVLRPAEAVTLLSPRGRCAFEVHPNSLLPVPIEYNLVQRVLRPAEAVALLSPLRSFAFP